MVHPLAIATRHTAYPWRDGMTKDTEPPPEKAYYKRCRMAGCARRVGPYLTPNAAELAMAVHQHWRHFAIRAALPMWPDSTGE
jgi:hypothetical protein